MKKFNIGTICNINASSLCQTDSFDVIEYLDTGSITDNVIASTQTLKLSEAPSRAQRKVKNNTIIYSTVRPNLKHYGILSCPPDNYIVSTGFVTLDVKDEYKEYINPYYLYFELTQPYVSEHLHGIAQNSVSSYPSINPSDIRNINFDFPDIKIQKKSVTLLCALEEKMQINRRIIETINSASKELFFHWFAQYEYPVDGGQGYRSSGEEMHWNDQVKREVPVNWSIKTIRDIMSIDTTIVDPKKLGDTVMEHYSIPAFDERHVPIFESAAAIDSSKYKVFPDSILISKLNPQFKRLWDPFCATEYAVCSTEFIVFRPNEDRIRPFCYAILDSDEFSAHMVAKATSSTGSRKRINPDVSASFVFAMPPESVIIKFVEKYKSLMGKQKLAYEENSKLMELRDNILPQLMEDTVSECSSQTIRFLRNATRI